MNFPHPLLILLFINLLIFYLQSLKAFMNLMLIILYTCHIRTFSIVTLGKIRYLNRICIFKHCFMFKAYLNLKTIIESIQNQIPLLLSHFFLVLLNLPFFSLALLNFALFGIVLSSHALLHNQTMLALVITVDFKYQVVRNLELREKYKE